MKNVVIIGGMAAGCKTAARLKRNMPDARITIIEKHEFVSYGTCGMPFFASGDIDSFIDLAKTSYGVVRDAEYFKSVKGVDVETGKEVFKIDTTLKIVFYRDINTSEESQVNYDCLVIATGSKAAKPKFHCHESEMISNFHSPVDALNFRKKAQTGKIGSAIIIGGGYIGCELAEALVGMWGIDTTIVELEDHLLPKSLDSEMAKFLEKAISENNINIKTKTKVDKVEISGGSPVVYTSAGDQLSADHVFLCVGIQPNTELAQAIGCHIGKFGGISTNNRLMTSIDNIYTAGDCAEIKNLVTGRPDYFPLGSLANRQGRVIADNIAGYESRFRGSVGTISTKVFDLVTGAAGITAKRARQLGYDYFEVAGSWYDRPEYMPDYFNISAKMIVEIETSRLLGIQIIGKGEVTRYIDAFSAYLINGAAVQDLIDHEHAYTPTHSGPINILNNLGYMAEAYLKYGISSASEIDGYDLVLDVRETSEVESAPFDFPTLNIPLGELRNRLNDIPNARILAICYKGPRSYEAARILRHNGFPDADYRCGGKSFVDIAL